MRISMLNISHINIPFFLAFLFTGKKEVRVTWPARKQNLWEVADRFLEATTVCDHRSFHTKGSGAFSLQCPVYQIFHDRDPLGPDLA